MWSSWQERHRYPPLADDLWVLLFRAAGYQRRGEPRGDRARGRLRVFRVAASAPCGGLEWSISVRSAMAVFADHGDPGRIWTARVDALYWVGLAAPGTVLVDPAGLQIRELHRSWLPDHLLRREAAAPTRPGI